MKIDKALEKMDERYNKRRDIRIKKAHDYAKDADCLANFKVMGDLAAVLKGHGMPIPIDTPEGTALWHLLHKYVRVLNLLSINEDPENESLADSFMDLENYSELALECKEDKE